jgi:hypothetical protein
LNAAAGAVVNQQANDVLGGIHNFIVTVTGSDSPAKIPDPTVTCGAETAVALGLASVY